MMKQGKGVISKEQQRSDFALDQLNLVMKSQEKVSQELANFIVGTPTMILQNGFGQTMAFLLAKCDGRPDPMNKHYFTFKAIAGWSSVINPAIPGGHMDFFKAVAALGQQEYLTVQEEALKMLLWLKRYAKAFQGGA
ncbi:MAG: type III-B CRISPR module-associated protein Cmr5 [Desulfamplus sp.]|nr:type III-B CRISPR module-associated protein Cmr5 [Desulfamplus sp.]